MGIVWWRLGPGDETRALEHCSRFWSMKCGLDDLRAFLGDPSSILVVAEVDGRPAGQIFGYLLKRWDSQGPMLFVYSIDVAEPYRRRGIARRLFEKAREIGRAAGSCRTFLVTQEDNAAAMATYEALGGRRPHPDDVVFVWSEAPSVDRSDRSCRVADGSVDARTRGALAEQMSGFLERSHAGDRLESCDVDGRSTCEDERG